MLLCGQVAGRAVATAPASHARFVLTMTQIPQRYYFGREVAVSDRSIIKRYELPARRYLGPTSMEAEMAFIMCNMAKVGVWVDEGGGLASAHLLKDSWAGGRGVGRDVHEPGDQGSI